MMTSVVLIEIGLAAVLVMALVSLLVLALHD